MALAAIALPRQLLPANLRPAIRRRRSNADRFCPPAFPTVVAHPRLHYPHRSNPHSPAARSRHRLIDRSRGFLPWRFSYAGPRACGTVRDGPASENLHNSGLVRRSKQQPYSITSSARASSIGGTSRPSAFAVLRLIASSNFVGCSIGRSEGLAPFKILTTNAAARRLRSGTFGP
jgi:hypothetical protein